MSALLFHVLFLLEADTDLLFEIKRLDGPSEDPAAVYFWFRFDKASRALQQLTFVGMSQSELVQRREFAEGQLAFDATRGTYQPHSDALPLQLQTNSPDTLPPAAAAAVQAFLAMQ